MPGAGIKKPRKINDLFRFGANKGQEFQPTMYVAPIFSILYVHTVFWRAP